MNKCSFPLSHLLSCVYALLIALVLTSAASVAQSDAVLRERTSFDAAKDFNHGTACFTYCTKVGNGDGPADPKFDASGWRELDLSHDWAVAAQPSLANVGLPSPSHA
jgi:beta-galactosidase